MDLSVVILSYNVRYLLESCLDSVLLATKSVTSEIIVVDNASTDGSAQMVQSRYPQVKLVMLDVNLGFSKANNIGVTYAGGDCILILNPDTIVNEDAILTCMLYLKQHTAVGAVGVRMLDVHGKYLEESKRGFPDAATSFFKLTGINKLFPHHPAINHYAMGHLSIHGTHEVEVLTGAFLMMPRNDFKQLGGFDENFFMYGEDIDLSHRIRLAHKKLVYIGKAHITHLKGRSARSHDYNHVRDFYQAMSIFVKKYHRNFIQLWFIQFLIQLTIFVSWSKRKAFNHYLFVLDFAAVTLTLWIVQYGWANIWFKDSGHFNNVVFYWSSSFYIIVWLLTLFFFKTYNPLHERQRMTTAKAMWMGTCVILIIYSLLPLSLRSSRAIIVFTGLILSVLLPLWRKFLSSSGNGLRGMIVGTALDEQDLNVLFRKLNHHDYFSYVSFYDTSEHSISDQENSAELRDCLRRQKISQLILNATNASRSSILNLAKIAGPHIGIFLADPTHEALVNRFSIPGLVAVNLKIADVQHRVARKLLNAVWSLLILPWGWVRSDVRAHFFKLLSGKLYWIGYATPSDQNLPKITPGLWPPMSFYLQAEVPIEELNYTYARDYSLAMDVQIILYHLFNKN